MALQLALSLHYMLCNGGHRSPEDVVPTLRQVFCGAARKESHLPFQLSGMRQVDTRAEEHDDSVTVFVISKAELDALACLTIETTVDFAC